MLQKIRARIFLAFVFLVILSFKMIKALNKITDIITLDFVKH
jgi:hypothetical protein